MVESAVFGAVKGGDAVAVRENDCNSCKCSDCCGGSRGGGGRVILSSGISSISIATMRLGILAVL
jgi:hypothetical protein